MMNQRSTLFKSRIQTAISRKQPSKERQADSAVMIWLYPNVVEVVVARKERFWSKKRPEESYDAIVIGSGMGGMTTAALLSKMGKKVLVLEQHYVPGGFTHTFRRKGYEWDVGVHAVGDHVSELSGEFTLAIEMGAVLEDLAHTIHAHPTLSEGLAEASLHALGKPVHISAKSR